ncbi:L-fucono-1,5-lactonase-like [Ylistrum balloti]|uniref:L-fucono-1,5-lactonase-like n=1 Tax=Ylistrum balloti TaxID=509963 RepID=UPI002905F5EA|nr:L-fucono-1,5-lactonase-like [Ylistrum balloti]
MAASDIGGQKGYVDSHFHIWDLQKFDYPWPTSQEGPIYRNVSPKEYVNSLNGTPVRHGVFVQCLNGNPEESKWVMDQAKSYPEVKGVVGGIDLTDPNLRETLTDLRKYHLFKGVRHILDMEDPTWITRDDVHKGLTVLEELGLTFDLLLRPHHLSYIPGVVAKFPRLKMVVDHIAKPYIKDKKIDQWKLDMSEIAKQSDNLYCKISGLVTEADWNSWQTEDFVPYVQHILSCFGVDRVMFGSDWPVCTLTKASFNDVYDLFNRLISSLSVEDKVKVLRDNAKDFYSLDI